MDISVNRLLEKNAKTDKKARKLFNSIRMWYTENSDVARAGRFKKPDEPFVLVTKEKLDTAELDTLLSIYASWMGYYQYYVAFYKGLSDHLESLYTTSINEYVITSKAESSDAKRSAAAKVYNAPLQRAEQIARAKYFDVQSKFSMASIQHSLVSRVISLRSDELKSMRSN